MHEGQKNFNNELWSPYMLNPKDAQAYAQRWIE